MFRKGDHSDSDSDVEQEDKQVHPNVTTSLDEESTNQDDSASEDGEGGLFGNLMDIPDQPVEEEASVTYKTREFPIPKHLPSAFTLPKRLLSDFLYANTKTRALAVNGTTGKKDERYKDVPGKIAVLRIEYGDVSKASRAKRVKLEVEWSPDFGVGGVKNNKGSKQTNGTRNSAANNGASNKSPNGLPEALEKLSLSSPTPAESIKPTKKPYTYSWVMETTACPSLAEAEHYISLVLLHELTTGTPHSQLFQTKSAALGIDWVKPPKPIVPALNDEKKPEDIKSSPSSSKDSTPVQTSPPKPAEPEPEPISPLEAAVPLWLPEYPPIKAQYLPLPYRDLWEEMEAIRVDWTDMANRQVWRKLDGLLNKTGQEPLSDKTDGDVKEISTVPAEPKNKQKKGRTGNQSSNRNIEPDQRILDAWSARSNSQAYKAMLEQRNTLPIAAFREEIVNTLKSNQVLVLSGETGCGKSTQLPSYLLEDHLSHGLPCKIFVTEPRRISAISLAERVSRELGDRGVETAGAGEDGGLVGYSIRLESKIGRNTVSDD
jgi:hypothetical protein